MFTVNSPCVANTLSLMKLKCVGECGNEIKVREARVVNQMERNAVGDR